MPNSQQNVTNIPSNRVEFIDSKTGLVSREWYRFFVNLFNLSGSGGNQTSLDDLQVGPPPQPVSTSGGGGGTGTVTSVDVSGGTTGLTTSGGPITSSGTITLGGTLNVTNGGTGATTAAGAPFALKGANTDITSLTGLTGAVSSPTSIQMGNGSGTTLAAGKMWYDQTTGSWNMGMGNGNITQQVGEEIFIYGKASAAITEGQLIVKTGTVGASNVITFAPSPTGLTVNDGIIGVATENIALNGFGRITYFGVVHGINTTGASVGETWADNDTLYYNPSYAGGFTKVKPSAPYIKYGIATVINAGSGGSGSIQVDLQPGSTLGGTDSNVQLGTPSNGQILTYDGADSYWKNTSIASGTGISVSAASDGTLTITNTSPSSGGTVTSVTGTSPVVSSGGTTPAISLASGYGDTLNPYASKTANYFLAAPNGSAGVPTFRAVVAADIPTLNQNTTGTAANITATSNSTLTTLSALSLPGSQVTGNISGNAANVTGTVAIANGGTGQTSFTANYIHYGSFSTSASLQFDGTTMRVGATALLGGTTNPILGITGSANQYIQSYIYNASTGASASADFVAYANNSTDAHGWADIGFTGSNYADATYTVTGPNEAYVFGSALNSSYTGNLVYATDSTGSANSHQWYVGGFTQAKSAWRMQLTSSLLQAKGTLQLMGSSSGYVGLQGAAAAGSTTYTLPSADGTSGQALTTNGSGTLAWATPSGSSNITAKGMWENALTISSNYAIGSGNSAVSAGPITIAAGVSVTVPSGSRWVIV